MIPLRVSLKNFLCHREQVFEFDGHPVWLLHGPNGVGKSAVFDAMIYALFGKHKRREGSDTAVKDLVRYGESSMRIEFDFEYRGRRFRIWRTRSRSGQPKQGVAEFLDGNTTPRPLSAVNNDDELKDWVSATLGLTYSTFVSSVLLRQGAAEKLIDADRKERRDVFRGIIDLEPYIRLHEAVTAERTGIGRDIRELEATLGEMPDVTEEMIAAATAVRDEAQFAWERERAAEIAARERLAHAQRWDGFDAMCRTLRQQLDAAHARTARSADLERSVARVRELRLVVPALDRVAELKVKSEAAEARVHQLTADRTTATEHHTELVAAAQQERDKATLHRARVAELDRTIAATTAECDRLRKEIQQAEKAADLHRKLAEERAKQFDADLDAKLAIAEAALTAAQAARDALPHLDRIRSHRTAYFHATVDAHSATERGSAAALALAQLQTDETEAKQYADDEEDRATSAGQVAAVAENDLVKARKALEEFSDVAGEAICSRCLQPIDAEHAARERTTLKAALQAATTQAERLRVEARTATGSATAARTAARQAEVERRRIEEDRAAANRDRLQAEKLAATSRTAFENERIALSPELAERVGEIDTGTFPEESDVAATRATSLLVKARTGALNDLRTLCQERDTSASTIETLLQAIHVVGVPADVTTARAELEKGEQRLAELGRERSVAEAEQHAASNAERDLGQTIVVAAADVNRLSAAEGGAEAEARTVRNSYDEAVRNLPDSALTWDPAALAAERDELEAANVEHDFAALAEDRTLHAERRRRLDEAERQIEETVPADARRPSEEVAPEVASTVQAVREAEGARDAARSEWENRTRQRAEREHARTRLTAAGHRHALHDRLAELLGPRGMQLDLVRTAERRIIELADQLLGDVSCGDLRFEPPDPAATEPFDLSVRQLGVPDPISVGNLSGGQRCRVAVSLALAVCRYACGEAQPLQSVIIDEAFAALDRDGRMAMIDVLRDGRIAGDILRRIILVSHHEDVAAAFPVGYRLAYDGGITTATRFGT